jgi:flagellar hook-associated protein 2
MAAITSSVGLISGINTGAIVTALINQSSGPVSLLQTRVDSNTALNADYQDLQTQLSSLQTTVQTLEQPSTFQAANASSSNPSVLTATAANGAAVGSYTLQVAQLVSTQQLISTGFTNATNSPVGAGTITIEEGGGGLATQTPLSELNGGAGVGRGEFSITDRAGGSAVINTSNAVTLDDVVNDINTATGISVRASISDNHLVLTDTSGQTAGNLIVQDLGSGSSAADLGITGNTAGSTITGTNINYLSSGTLLAQLNDGRGVTLGSGNGDFNINLSNGSTVKVNLATATTVGAVVNAINTAGGGKVTASIPAGSTGIKLTDNTTGNGTLSVTDINGSQAGQDLGLTTGTTSGKTLTGTPVLASIDSTLLSSLNGGAGLSLGKIAFTDRSGASQTIDFSGDSSVQDVLDSINNATGVKLSASLNSAGNGIQISDASGGTGNLTIADADGGTSAEKLGIAGSFGTETQTVQGGDLDKQWVTSSTLLSSLNGGKGIDQSAFTITNSKGVVSTINLAGGNVTTVGQLLYQINNAPNAGVTASINSTGNGIELTDTAGGAAKLTVADTTGTAAADLNIAGTATGTTINGAYEKTLTVGANDTLSTVATAINNLHFGVTATVINDGSSVAPYRLSLTANNSGTAGGVVVDTGTTNLGTQTLVNAQNAAVFIGSSTSSQPLLVTSSTNNITNVISGVTLNLQGVSSSPVTLNVSQDTSGISTALNSFVTTFNSLTSQISTQSTFNTSNNTAGVLLGNPVASNITSSLYNTLNDVVGGGSYKVLAQLGITVGNNGQLTFDQDTFNAAIATDPAAVENLFNATTTTKTANGSSTTVNTGIAYKLDSALTQLIDPVSGILTSAEKELTAESTGFNTQITQLNALLAQQKSTLEAQFANMESVLANLQTQSASLGSIGASTAATKAASSSSSSTTG